MQTEPFPPCLTPPTQSQKSDFLKVEYNLQPVVNSLMKTAKIEGRLSQLSLSENNIFLKRQCRACQCFKYLRETKVKCAFFRPNFRLIKCVDEHLAKQAPFFF